MKKGLIILFILVMLISTSFVISQNNNQDKDPFLEGLRILFGVKMSQSFDIPNNLQAPARIIFGIKGTISPQDLIILFSVWFILFLTIAEILKFSSLFKGWIAYALSFFVTSLIAVIGVIRSLSIFFFNIGSLFGILEQWPVVVIILTIAIVILLFIGINFFLKILRKNYELMESEKKGFSIAKLIKTAEATEDLS